MGPLGGITFSISFLAILVLLPALNILSEPRLCRGKLRESKDGSGAVCSAHRRFEK